MDKSPLNYMLRCTLNVISWVQMRTLLLLLPPSAPISTHLLLPGIKFLQLLCNNTKINYKIHKIALWLIIITINVIHRWQMCPRRNQVERLQCTSRWGERGILSDPGITDHNICESTRVNESSPARKCFNQRGVRNYWIKTRKKLLFPEY